MSDQGFESLKDNSEITLSQMLGFAAGKGYAEGMKDYYDSDVQFKDVVDKAVIRYRGIYDSQNRILDTISIDEVAQIVFPLLQDQMQKDDQSLIHTVTDTINETLKAYNVPVIQQSYDKVRNYIMGKVSEYVQRSATHSFLAYTLGIRFNRVEIGARRVFFMSRHRSRLTIEERLLNTFIGQDRYSHDEINKISEWLIQVAPQIREKTIIPWYQFDTSVLVERTIPNIRKHFYIFEEYYRKVVRDVTGLELPVREPYAVWTDEERERLFSKSGYTWAELVEMFPGKNENQIRNQIELRTRMHENGVFHSSPDPLGFSTSWYAIQNLSDLNGAQRRELAALLNSEEGISSVEAAKRFGVKRSTILNYPRILIDTGLLPEGKGFVSNRSWHPEDDAILTSFISSELTYAQIYEAIKDSLTKKRSLRAVEERLRNMRNNAKES